MDYLFNNGFENILCTYSKGNIKSKKVIDKLGFQLYVIEKDSWIKDGISITEYKNIISNDQFYKLHSNKIKKYYNIKSK